MRALVLLLAACTGPTPGDSAAPPPGHPDYVRDPALDVALTSAPDGAESHAAGEPCMHCHQAHADGPGRFTVAGTVYRSDGSTATEGSIQLWTGSGTEGTLLLEVAVDALGNFYTTEDVGFPDVSVQPVVVDAEGTTVNAMPWPTESGSCNQCHTPVRRVVLP